MRVYATHVIDGGSSFRLSFVFLFSCYSLVHFSLHSPERLSCDSSTTLSRSLALESQSINVNYVIRFFFCGFIGFSFSGSRMISSFALSSINTSALSLSAFLFTVIERRYLVNQRAQTRTHTHTHIPMLDAHHLPVCFLFCSTLPFTTSERNQRRVQTTQYSSSSCAE
jgi:hypothetical protein